MLGVAALGVAAPMKTAQNHGPRRIPVEKAFLCLFYQLFAQHGFCAVQLVFYFDGGSGGGHSGSENARMGEIGEADLKRRFYELRSGMVWEKEIL